MAASPGRSSDDRIAEEQAALRRVAVLVARAAPPDEVFAAITEEAGRLLGVGHAVLSRYDPDGTISAVGAWSRDGAAVPVGTRVTLGGCNVHTLVFRTGREARLDDYAGASGAVADIGRELGLGGTVGAPVSVEGRLWGVMAIASIHERPLPADAEARLAGFTELAATAIANAQAQVALRSFAEEQAALRRLAMLVARGASPEEVFAAVTEGAGRVLNTDLARMNRYDPDGGHVVVAGWTSTGDTMPVPLGSRWGPGGRNVAALVFQTGRPARIDDYANATGSGANLVRSWGLRSAVGAPVSIEGRLWGVLAVGSRVEPLPADTEARLAGFTELAATALANAEARAALTASRARIVAAADQTRRRVERDLHDGAQQRLVSLMLYLRATQATVPPGADEVVERLEGAIAEATAIQETLREISRGLHPAVLTVGGLRTALRALARHSAVPVSLDVQLAGRLAEPVEIAAYYVVSEALTNTAKHARASAAEVEVTADADVLRLRVCDDGCGGADFSRGSGLTGLKDRVEAFGGRISLRSPPGAGTTLEVALPIDDLGSPELCQESSPGGP